MDDKLFAIDGVQNLTETESQNIDGGMMFGFLADFLKLGAGIGAGYLAARYVDGC